MMQWLGTQVIMLNGKFKDLRKWDNRKMEMVHGKFTAMLWNTGIHSMASRGRKLYENDQNKYINKGDIWNNDDMTDG